jgi:hypothetical protein
MEAADSDENLYPLRDFLAGNPGYNTLFIHIPVGGSEKIIRTETGINTVEAFNNCAGVAEAWRE